MLQFTVTKSGNSLIVSLKTKQQEGPPLSSQSAHPPGVCLWPIIFSKSLGALLLNPAHLRIAREGIVDRFFSSHSPPWLVSALQRLMHERRPPSKAPTTLSSCGDPTWLMLDWHPALRDARFSKILAEHVSSPLWSGLLAAANMPLEQIRISWRMRIPRISHIVGR